MFDGFVAGLDYVIRDLVVTLVAPGARTVRALG